MLYYGARYYDPSLGRFTQPDPVVVDTTRKEFAQTLANPQLQNPYSYVGNNPVKDIDEKGESKISFLSKLFGKLAGPINIATTAYDLLKPVKGSNDQQLAQAYGLVPDGKGGYTQLAQAQQLQCQQVVQCQLAQNSGAQAGNQVQNQALLMVGATTNGGGLKVGDSFGKLGTVVENAPGKIAGYTSHGADKKILRSVSSDIIKETVEHPLVVMEQSQGGRLYLTEKAVVVLNKAGQLITTYGKELFEEPIKNILKLAK